MRKVLLVVILTFLSLFTFYPVRAQASTVSDGFFVEMGKNSWGNPYYEQNDNQYLNPNQNVDQDCVGSDSLLGNPDDPDSVAWLLDKILTYVTIIGMILVVVLSSVDFIKVIAKGDDEAMGKAAKKLFLRLLLGALLFFVPTLTNAMLDIFGLTSDSTCGIHQ